MGRANHPSPILHLPSKQIERWCAKQSPKLGINEVSASRHDEDAVNALSDGCVEHFVQGLIVLH